MLALRRMRAQLVRFRTAQVNGLRGLLAEYGEVMPQGRAGIRRDVPAALGWLAERLPAVVIDTSTASVRRKAAPLMASRPAVLNEASAAGLGAQKPAAGAASGTDTAGFAGGAGTAGAIGGAGGLTSSAASCCGAAGSGAATGGTGTDAGGSMWASGGGKRAKFGSGAAMD